MEANLQRIRELERRKLFPEHRMRAISKLIEKQFFIDRTI